MKVEDKDDLPSSSGVSDGDEEDEEDVPMKAFTLLKISKFGNSIITTEKISTDSFLSGSDAIINELDINKINSSEKYFLNKKHISSVIPDGNVASKSYINSDINNSYVFVTTNGRCSYADVHQTSANIHLCRGGNEEPELSIDIHGSRCAKVPHLKNSMRFPFPMYNEGQIEGEDSAYRLSCASSDESDGNRDLPSDEHYEGSEENDDDDLFSNRIYDKSRFNHYQKLLKEHEFVQGGDEEEYLQFLYHRHLYYNQLQKISPQNIKLFRRLENMQNSRFKSSGRANSMNNPDNKISFDASRHSISDSHFRKITRRSKLSDSHSSNRCPRNRPSARSQQHNRVSRHHTSSTSHSICSTSAFTHLDNFLTIPFLLLAFLSFLLVVESGNGCRMSEFTCGNMRADGCIRADAYCDGETDCQDRSDEPRDCSREY